MGDHGSIRGQRYDGVAIDTLEEIMETYRYRVLIPIRCNERPCPRSGGEAGWEEKYGERIKFNTLQAALKEVKLGPKDSVFKTTDSIHPLREYG